jgi:hypothetical protein
MVPTSNGELPSLRAICLVGAAVMSYGMCVPSPLLHYLASVYAWIFVGASVLAVFGCLMLRLRPPTVFQGGSVEEDAVPWNRKTYRRRVTVA